MSRPAEVIDIPYTLDLFDMRDRLRSGLTYILGNASLLAAFADVFAMVTRWRGACRGEEETMSIKSILSFNWQPPQLHCTARTKKIDRTTIKSSGLSDKATEISSARQEKRVSAQASFPRPNPNPLSTDPISSPLPFFPPKYHQLREM